MIIVFWQKCLYFGLYQRITSSFVLWGKIWSDSTFSGGFYFRTRATCCNVRERLCMLRNPKDVYDKWHEGFWIRSVWHAAATALGVESDVGCFIYNFNFLLFHVFWQIIFISANLSSKEKKSKYSGSDEKNELINEKVVAEKIKLKIENNINYNKELLFWESIFIFVWYEKTYIYLYIYKS